MSESFRSVSLPKAMVDECEFLAKHPKLKHLGFLSHTDLIRQAVQDRITTLKTQVTYHNFKEKNKK